MHLWLRHQRPVTILWLLNRATLDAQSRAEMKRDPNAMPSKSKTTMRGECSVTRVDAIALLIIAAAAAVLVLPVFLRGFPGGDDIIHHYRWSYYFVEALREGAMYPRWLAHANRGYGSAVMFYYPPLEFYSVAAFNVFARNLLQAIELSCALAMLLSGLAMYLFSRRLLSRGASLIAAVMYMATPYHLFDLYRVNGLSEYWSFAWIPLVFDAATRIAEGRGWRAAAYLAASYASLLFTHVPVSLMVGLMLPIYVVVITRNRMRLLQAAAGLILGSGCAAAFLVSLLFETKYVHIKRILDFSYADYFMFENLSAIWPAKLLSMADYARLPGYVTEANIVAVGVAVLLALTAIAMWIARRSIHQSPTASRLLIAFWSIAVISVLMTSRLSAPFWRVIRPLQYLQFPSRWLAIAAAPACLLTAVALSALIEARRSYILPVVVLGGAIAVNVAISAHVATQQPAEPDRLLGELTLPDVREYSPLTWDEQFHEEFDKSPVVVESGDAEVRAIDGGGATQSYQVSATTNAVLKFRSLFFPGWAARVDGKQADVQRNNEGHIQLTIPSGEHMLTLRFEQTSRHIKANFVSVVSILGLAAMFIFTRASTDEKKLAVLEDSDRRV